MQWTELLHNPYLCTEKKVEEKIKNQEIIFGLNISDSYFCAPITD